MKGETLVGLDVHLPVEVSIHSPVKGETRDGATMTRARTSFNPLAREGRDFVFHAVLLLTNGFNPLAREGRDVAFRHVGRASHRFQSTRP